MKRTTIVTRLFAAVTCVAASVSCGNVVREGRSPVYLTIDSLQGLRGGPNTATPSGFLLSDVQTLVTAPAPCSPTSPCPTIFNDAGQALLRAPLKNVGASSTPTAPTTNNEVTITRIRIDYVRADGRNTPGVDVPYGFDSAATGTIPAGGTLSLGFEIVRHASKQESPLKQLITSPTIITTIGRVTFYGKDRVGNDVSATGQIQIDFGNFGD